MSEDKNQPKGQQDKPFEEKEKLDRELERSLRVAKVKAAHKQIEDTEKSRKHASILSIFGRINHFVDCAVGQLNVLIEGGKRYPQLHKQYQDIRIDSDSFNLLQNVEDYGQMYVSIRYDLKKTLDIGDEAMEKLFPTLKFRKDTLVHYIDDLQSICFQLQQMQAYCQRLLV
jgi:hypothetical protein